MINTIAVLITVHNRKEKTLSCLTALFNCVLPDEYRFDVFLVDDGSTDGTSEVIRKKFTQVNIIQGTGNLFWNRGMYLAWETAAKTNDYDYYLWLNDDTVLYNYCMEEIFNCLNFTGEDCIIQGVLETQDKSEIAYSGYDSEQNPIVPDGKMQNVVFLHGNVVLVTKSVYKKTGNLDYRFHHYMGDPDYGLRAQRHGFKIYSTTKAIGYGEKNNNMSINRKFEASIFQRFKHLYSPLGNPPYISFYYNKKYNGYIQATIKYIYVHIINLIPDKMYKYWLLILHK
jgi:GT2 family glycosyltransferase